VRPCRAHPARAFSLIELVIVVVIIGIIGAIAIPRMSSAAENAAKNAVRHDQSALQRAIDLYTEEHGGMLPDVGAGSQKVFVLRLLARTTENGTVDADGIYGPYLHAVPPNAINGLSTIRRGGAAAGANTHGWHYTPSTGRIVPDHGTATGHKPVVDGEADVTAAEIAEAKKRD
jgi:prepilin-type N-terminal cleavage/methylation domain-containing protein